MLAAEEFLENLTSVVKICVVLFLVYKFGSLLFTVPKNQKKYKEDLQKEKDEIEKRREMRAKGIRPEDHEHHHHHHAHHGKFNLKGFMIWGSVTVCVLFISLILILNGCKNRNKKRTHREYVKIEKEAIHKAASFLLPKTCY